MFDSISPEITSGLAIAIKYAFKLLPLLLPVVFLKILFDAWVGYRRAEYWNNKLGSVLLEIKLPPEINKSPLAMEVVLNQMHQTADEGSWYWKYWRGQTRSWFSLEIVSYGGEIHFYIWTRKKYKNGLEAHLYSQYPGIEVYEVEDYAKKYYFDPDKHGMWVSEWKLTEADPWPIATYVDYGLDKDPKEEHKVDPMTNQLEFLGTVTKGHTIMIQIIVRAHVKESKKLLPFSKMIENFSFFEKYDAWKETSEAEVKKIVDKLKVEGGGSFPRIATKGEQARIEALQRSVGKIGFDVGIRTIIHANKDIYNSGFLGGLIGSFKQYGSLGYNGFKPSGWHSKYSNPPIDWLKTSKDVLSKMALDEYKLRNYFFSPYRGKWFYSEPFVLNAEELATIYHFPGAVATTPTLPRIPSKKAEAPSNLPV